MGLGDTRYIAQGHDIGAAVTDAMAIQAPEGLAGIHLNFLRRPPPGVTAALLGRAPVPHGLTDSERAAFAAFGAQTRKGYIAEQGGHFAAWEEPQLFATEVRAAFKSVR